MIELEFVSEEFERDLEELRHAERCEPCDEASCEYAPMCRLVRGDYDE